MDEQTGDPFSVKNQLLHSKLHFDTGRVRVEGGGGWEGTCICCLKRSHKRLRPHESIRSHTCALSLISAECKQFQHSFGRIWHGAGRRVGRGQLSSVTRYSFSQKHAEMLCRKKTFRQKRLGKKNVQSALWLV